MVKAGEASRICYYKECGFSDQQIVEKVVEEKYAECVSEIEGTLKEREPRFRDEDRTARVACFTESIYSKFMWDAYAGGYSGFALEYNLRELFTKNLEQLQQVYVFPVIYSDTKPDMTEVEANNFFLEYCAAREEMKALRPVLQKIPFNLISPFMPFLYKDRQEYEHEREWRMLFFCPGLSGDFVSVPDRQCITGVYYGPDTEDKDITLLHAIAKEKGIKEYKVSLDTESRRYDLRVTDY